MQKTKKTDCLSKMYEDGSRCGGFAKLFLGKSFSKEMVLRNSSKFLLLQKMIVRLVPLAQRTRRGSIVSSRGGTKCVNMLGKRTSRKRKVKYFLANLPEIISDFSFRAWTEEKLKKLRTQTNGIYHFKTNLCRRCGWRVNIVRVACAHECTHTIVLGKIRIQVHLLCFTIICTHTRNREACKTAYWPILIAACTKTAAVAAADGRQDCVLRPNDTRPRRWRNSTSGSPCSSVATFSQWLNVLFKSLKSPPKEHCFETCKLKGICVSPCVLNYIKHFIILRIFLLTQMIQPVGLF